MSADGWSNCIACQAKAQKEYDRLSQALADQYGEVSMDKYRELISDQKAAYDRLLGFNPFEEGTLAEYFEFSWRGNVLTVDYSASCRVCGFEPSYEATKEFEV